MFTPSYNEERNTINPMSRRTVGSKLRYVVSILASNGNLMTRLHAFVAQDIVSCWDASSAMKPRRSRYSVRVSKLGLMEVIRRS